MDLSLQQLIYISHINEFCGKQRLDCCLSITKFPQVGPLGAGRVTELKTKFSLLFSWGPQNVKETEDHTLTHKCFLKLFPNFTYDHGGTPNEESRVQSQHFIQGRFQAWSCTTLLHAQACGVLPQLSQSLLWGLVALPLSSHNNLHFLLTLSYAWMNRFVQLFGHTYAVLPFWKVLRILDDIFCMVSVSVQVQSAGRNQTSYSIRENLIEDC